MRCGRRPTWTAATPPGEDTGSEDYERYPSEWYAELFAFMSMVAPDEAARADYGGRARTLLMHVIDRALPGAGSEGEAFRDPQFATFNRSRWYGDGFGLTVDWAYPYFAAEDKAKIRTVFLRWAGELFTAYPAMVGGPVRGAVPPRAGEPLHVRHLADRGDDQVGLQPGAVGWLHPGGAVSAEQLMPRGPTR